MAMRPAPPIPAARPLPPMVRAPVGLRPAPPFRRDGYNWLAASADPYGYGANRFGPAGIITQMELGNVGYGGGVTTVVEDVYDSDNADLGCDTSLPEQLSANMGHEADVRFGAEVGKPRFGIGTIIPSTASPKPKPSLDSASGGDGDASAGYDRKYPGMHGESAFGYERWPHEHRQDYANRDYGMAGALYRPQSLAAAYGSVNQYAGQGMGIEQRPLPPASNNSYQRWEEVHPGTPYQDYANWWSQYGSKGASINGEGTQAWAG